MKDPNYKKRAEKIKAAIESKNLRRRQIAAALDIPNEGLYKRFNGTVPWRLHELEKIAALTGNSVTDFIIDS